MFLSALCDRTAKVQNFPDVTIEKSQNFPTLIYFSIYTYSTCHMEGTPTASTKTDKLSESCKFSLFFLFVSKLILIFAPAFSNECKDILPNGLLITTRECRAKQLILELTQIWAQTSHIQLWLVVSQETYGDSLRLFFRRN